MLARVLAMSVLAAHFLAESQALLINCHCLFVVALRRISVADVVEQLRNSRPVAHLFVQASALLKIVQRPRVVALRVMKYSRCF